MISERFLLDALYLIERQEAKGLTWGLVDGELSTDDLHRCVSLVAEKISESADFDDLDADEIVDEIIDELEERALLLETRSGYYRSRMGETVRLLFRLRQLWPNQNWRDSATLVSDYRFILQPRRYPSRDLDTDQFLEKITNKSRESLVQGTLRDFLESRADGFVFSDFQAQATKEILSAVHAKEKASAGVLIGAGTGSGKTLAFYVPGLSIIADRILKERNSSDFVKCLAIYPRNELLKDQLGEVLRESRFFDRLLLGKQKRKIRVGVLFGPTPESVYAVQSRPEQGGWELGVDQSRVCDWVSCPIPDCRGRMLWEKVDLVESREKLTCENCGEVIDGDELVLTRKTLKKSPPDILFTTTEMLNQRMSDPAYHKLLGHYRKADSPVEMVLLDEVHTYAGIHGAQVAYLLRRWRNFSGRPVCFVGLSATIADGERFFQELTGVFEDKIRFIQPASSDLVEEGAEYMIALKGDPVSQKALLSTSIQTSMVISRILDHSKRRLSKGLLGTKTFVFTDDLDVTQRMYHNILDAEGLNARRREPLASLRDGEDEDKKAFGQDWWASRRVGHKLENPKKIGRTSSQDTGVDTKNDLIVATASLEVGFNDPNVGAVIQHKSPRQASQFLQRKGRAGRDRKMRPWTIVVLSDYGRDRSSYANYDLLFDPTLLPTNLPLNNRYVKRMQATYSLIEFLAKNLNPGDRSSWRILAGTKREDSSTFKFERAKLQSALEKLLTDENELREFERFLGFSLGFSKSESEEEVASLLWEHPRAIITACVPTALRRLETNWRSPNGEKTDLIVENNPLPDFVPANLFSDLNLPELRFRIGDSEDTKVMPMMQGMRSFAPGKVNRRFAVDFALESHWLISKEWLDSKDLSRSTIDLDEVAISQNAGVWRSVGPDGPKDWPVQRLHEIKLESAPRDVLVSSNAFLDWRTQILDGSDGLVIPVPAQNPIRKYVDQIQIHTHLRGDPLEVRRFAVSSEASIRIENDESEHRVIFDFEKSGEKTAVGFSFEADGVRLRLKRPDKILEELSDDVIEKWGSLRIHRYFDLAKKQEHLKTVSNPFLRQWLAEIYQAALIYWSLENKKPLETAVESVATAIKKDRDYLKKVLNTVFQTSVVVEDGGDSDEQVTLTDGRLRTELNRLLEDPTIISELKKMSKCLTEEVDSSWGAWLESIFATTIGAAVYSAIGDFCPNLNLDGLVMDLRKSTDSSEEGFFEILLTEQSPGGIGLVEEFVETLSEDPVIFWTLVEESFGPNESVVVDIELQAILSSLDKTVKDPSPLLSMVRDYRQSQGYSSTEKLAVIRTYLEKNGFLVSKALMTGLVNRILRPGSGDASDDLLRSLYQTWLQEERRLGIAIDARTFSYWASQEYASRIDAVVGLSPGIQNRDQWRFNAVQGMLWSRGMVIRNRDLEMYNPYFEFPIIEKLLVSELLITDFSANVLVVDEDGDWKHKSLKILSQRGMARIAIDRSDKERVAEVINFFILNPIDQDFLMLYAEILSIKYFKDEVVVSVVIKDQEGTD